MSVPIIFQCLKYQGKEKKVGTLFLKFTIDFSCTGILSLFGCRGVYVHSYYYFLDWRSVEGEEFQRASLTRKG